MKLGRSTPSQKPKEQNKTVNSSNSNTGSYADALMSSGNKNAVSPAITKSQNIAGAKNDVPIENFPKVSQPGLLKANNSGSYADALMGGGNKNAGSPGATKSQNFAGAKNDVPIDNIPKGSRADLFKNDNSGLISAEAAALLRPIEGNIQRTVLVAEYSSTGGGHTKRLLLPIADAAKEGGALKAGDTVVMLMPPRAELDHQGNNVREAHKYMGAGGIFEKLGLNVVTVQSDKTVTGMYKEGGASDNLGMLRSFVYAPRRDASAIRSSLNPNANANTNDETVKGYSAKDALKAILSVANREHVKVIGDMAPYLQKAAAAEKIETRVEIGNHQGLFVGAARDFLNEPTESREGKDLAYLAKASSATLYTKLALIDYDDKFNVLPDLPKTLEALKINEETTMFTAREVAVKHLLDTAERVNWKDGIKSGVIVGGDIKKSEDVSGITYIYVNEYTKDLVAHINKQIDTEQNNSALSKEQKPYSSTLFAVCGGGAFNKGKLETSDIKADNILHVAYAANANGVTSAGFGTTSEFNYLKSAGFQGKFLVAPVENQHEQEANAANLVKKFDGIVSSASGIEKLKEGLDAAVKAGIGSLTGQENMSQIILASRNVNTNSGHAADLLKGGNPTEKSLDVNDKMQKYIIEHSAKQARRMYKLFVPALDAIIFQDDKQELSSLNVKVRVTSKVEPTTLKLTEVIDLMKNPSDTRNVGSLEKLLQIKIDNVNVEAEIKKFGKQLEAFTKITDINERKETAIKFITELAEKNIALGW